MKEFGKKTWLLLKDTTSNFIDDDSFTYASSIAFSTIFSLPAILIITLTIAATVFERDVVQKELLNQVSSLAGKSTAEEIGGILERVALDDSGFIAKVIGIVTLAVSATTVFVSLQGTLNKVWKVRPKPERGWLKYILNRLLSLAMVISFGFVLLVSLVVDTILVVFRNFLSGLMEGVTLYLVTAFNVLISFGLIMLIFGLLFKFLPDGKVRWHHVWVGSALTAALFTGGKYLIGFYLGNSPVNSAYGAAGTLVVILLWVYYSTVIFLFGAEFTSAYARASGQEIEPFDNAVKIKLVEVEKSPH